MTDRPKKIKLLYFSDFSLAKTGFGKISLNLLHYLFQTGNYEIVHACMMMVENDPELDATPWKSIGTVPSNEQFSKAYQQDEKLRTIAGYGHYKIDEIVKNEKPDCILSVQDIWGIYNLVTKPYWNKIPCIFWTTLDSLPIHEKAIEASQKCASGNFWVWSNFAEKDMKKNGFNNVKTVHAPFIADEFKRFERVKKLELRKKFNISPDSYIILDIFRNQLRKSVFSTLEGYSLFKKDTPGVNSFLLLHTCFSEGWSIMKQAKYYGVPENEVLTTYICSQCHEYQVKAFTGEKQNCPFCRTNESQFTTGPKRGISEKQLSEIYNLADVLCHPTSNGGLELPASTEAKLCELPVLVPDYSYGEELCEPDAGSLKLDWTAYRDLQQNEFIRSAVHSKSVSRQLSKVYKMTDQERRDVGKQARKWAYDRFAVENAGKKIDELLQAQVLTDYNFDFTVEKPNPDAVIPEIEDDKEWLTSMYKNILKMDVAPDDKGLAGWLDKLKEVN